MGWKLYYFARRNLRTSRLLNKYGVGWRVWFCAWEVGAAVSGEGCLANTCSQGQGLGFTPISSGALLADVAQERAVVDLPTPQPYTTPSRPTQDPTFYFPGPI